MKKCPFCAEEIQDEAIKCKHCGSWLDERAKARKIPRKDSLDDEVRRLVNSGSKFDVKTIGPAEAKASAERFENPGATEKGKTSSSRVGFLLIVASFAVIFIASQFGSTTTPPSTGTSTSTSTSITTTALSTTPDLKATVSFTGTQFVITNNGAEDWTGVKLEINGGFFSGGYELRTERIAAGSTVSVGALQFAKRDGTRFNPYQLKPQKFVISANVGGMSGIYVGGWK